MSSRNLFNNALGFFFNFQIRNLCIGAKATPQRLQLFKTALLEAGVEDPDGNADDLSTEQWDNAASTLPQSDPVKPNCKILNPLEDTPLRWGSKKLMLQRARLIRAGLDKLAAMIKELRKDELSDSDWRNVDEVDDFLYPFFVISKYVEGSKYPTFSAVVPLYNQLLSDLVKWSEDMKRTIATRNAALSAIDKLKKYYNRLSPLNIVSVFIDPKLKYTYFRNHGWTNVEGSNLFEESVVPT